MLRLTNDGYGHLNSALTMCCFQLRLKPLGYFISIALVFKGFGARLQNSQLNIKFFSVLQETSEALAVVLLAMSMFFHECVIDCR